MADRGRLGLIVMTVRFPRVAIVAAIAFALAPAVAHAKWPNPVRISGKGEERFRVEDTSIAKRGLAAVSWVAKDRDFLHRYALTVAIRDRASKAFVRRLRVRAGERFTYVSAKADDQGEVVIAWTSANAHLHTAVYRPGKGLDLRRGYGKVSFVTGLQVRPNGRAIVAWSRNGRPYVARRTAGHAFSPSIRDDDSGVSGYSGVNLNDHGDASLYWYGDWGNHVGGYFVADLPHDASEREAPIKVPGSANNSGIAAFAFTNAGEVLALLSGSGNDIISVSATTYTPGQGFSNPTELESFDFETTLGVDGDGNALGIWGDYPNSRYNGLVQALKPSGMDWQAADLIRDRGYTRRNGPWVASSGRALLVAEHNRNYLALTGTAADGLTHSEKIGHFGPNADLDAAVSNSGRDLVSVVRRGVRVTEPR